MLVSLSLSSYSARKIISCGSKNVYKNLHNLNCFKSIFVSKHHDLLFQGHGMRRLKAIRRQDIFIDETVYGGMTQGELSQAREKELQLAQQDINMERTKEKKNTLEAYVYETRNKVHFCALSLLILSYSCVIIRFF